MWTNICSEHGEYEASESTTPCPRCGQMPTTISFTVGGTGRSDREMPKAAVECRKGIQVEQAVAPPMQPGKVNPFDIWDRMNLKQQRMFGAAAVGYALGKIGTIVIFHEPVPEQGYEAARGECSALLTQAIDVLKDPPLPDLSVLGIRTCRACGCTDHYGCEDGCYWIEDDLCSACLGPKRMGGEVAKKCA